MAFTFVAGVTAAIIISVKSGSVEPAVWIIGWLLGMAFLSLIVTLTTWRDYVEIKENEIKVVEAHIFRKKEQHFTLNDIKYAKVEFYSWDWFDEEGEFGKRPSRTTSGKYIIFRGHNNEYLFKMMYSRKRKDFWKEYVEFDNIIEF